MFAKLPELFSREFAIGYFIPAALFLLLITLGWQQYAGGISDGKTVEQTAATLTELIADALLGAGDEDAGSGTEELIGVSLFLLLAWLLALVLAALNRIVYRLLEGYWGRAREIFGFRSRQMAKWTELRDKEERLRAALNELEDEAAKVNAKSELGKVLIKRARYFPAHPDWVLPTSFGNILRAFETYSNTMFGLDAIPGWYRLLALLPDSFRKDIDAAKAFVDFWINLYVLSGVLLAYALALAVQGWTLAPLVFVPLLLVLMWLMFKGANSAALEWGEFVKAAIDLFRNKLRDQLALPVGADAAAARETWMNYSAAVVYRDPDAFPHSADTLGGGEP